MNAPPIVTTRGRIRRLEFLPGNVQSEMDLSDPLRLVLDYTRAMMGFALFVPQPRHIVMVGLGGGSLARFCRHAFPNARITVLEIRADVIALRAQFQVPLDDERFRVVHTDALPWLEACAEPADVLLVDGFDAMGLHAPLAGARFLGACRRVLDPYGVLVMNIFSYDPALPAVLARLHLMYGAHVSWLEGVAGNNRILFALKAPFDRPAGPLPRALKIQTWMAKQHGFRFALWNRWLIGWIVWRLRHSKKKQS